MPGRTLWRSVPECRPRLNPELPKLLPDLWKWTLASGVLAVILGICVQVWPGISILVAAILFGVHLLVSGIAQM